MKTLRAIRVFVPKWIQKGGFLYASLVDYNIEVVLDYQLSKFVKRIVI
jgi:hypothetical protein